MKKEELFLAIGKIEDQMIEKVEQEKTWNLNKKKTGGYKKVAVAAACVVVICAGIVTWLQNKGTEPTIQFVLSESGDIAGEMTSVKKLEWKHEAENALKAQENAYKLETAEVTNEELADVLLKLGIKKYEISDEDAAITYTGEKGGIVTYYKDSATLEYYNGEVSTEENEVSYSEEEYRNLAKEWLQRVNFISYSSLEFARISPRECIMVGETEQVISYSIEYRIKDDNHLVYEGRYPGVEVVISSGGQILSAEYSRRNRTDAVISCKLKGKKEIERAIRSMEHVEIVGEVYEVETLELTGCSIEYLWEGKNSKQEYLLPYYVLEGIDKASGSNVIITMPALKEYYLAYQK